ncbi:MAG: hypothetical protein QNJ98_00860 [Planctomycetota bacterium]|nr:hypothetical protein [Planctomycetota bacterium]
MNKPRTTTLVVLLVLLLLIVPIPLRGRVWKAGFDAGHLAIGAALGFLAARFLGLLGMRSSWLRDGLALAGATVAGIGMEWLQGFVGREPSWMDAATNAVGTGAWFLAHRARVAERAGPRRVIWTATGLLLAVGLFNPAITTVDAVRQARSFPLLASFEDRLELTRVGSRESTYACSPDHATHGNASLEVRLAAGTYPGVTLGSFPEDWSDYDALAFDLVVLGDAPLRLIFEAEDQHHDRKHYDYNDRFRLIESYAPGRHTVRVRLADVQAAPAKRRLNLSRMYTLIWFVNGLDAPRKFHLDNVRLLSD